MKPYGKLFINFVAFYEIPVLSHLVLLRRIRLFFLLQFARLLAGRFAKKNLTNKIPACASYQETRRKIKILYLDITLETIFF